MPARRDEAWAAPVADRNSEPKLISLTQAKVGDLALAQLDLSACHFDGAHGLDELRLERVQFAETPRGVRWGKPIWWTRRRVLAEEQEYRGTRWSPDGGDGSTAPHSRLSSDQIAALYRDLRKGREDSKDEPGAADFYYGEMEMRRQPARRDAEVAADINVRATPRAERAILGMYWLLAGYGLRASRALLALAATILAASLALWQEGFTRTPDYTRALLFSIESTSSLFRVPDTPGLRLTYTGEAIQITVRVLGPLLIGLALLSLRGRVKR